VIGLEVSRLARNSTDWHRLMEICVLTNTLILDEDGIYDPRQINDRLLLGLKGAISEFELHMIHSRLWGGKLAKARRGELHCELPIGFVYTPLGEMEVHTITATKSAFLTIYVPGGKNSGRDVVRELQVVVLIGLLANCLYRQ
jgi:DNA invertase Pin-like site-specific DNA recombinase